MRSARTEAALRSRRCPGDLLAIGYLAADYLPRVSDHIVAVVEDRGPGAGPPDGFLGREDLVADTGSADGLKFAAKELVESE